MRRSARLQKKAVDDEPPKKDTKKPVAVSTKTKMDKKQEPNKIETTKKSGKTSRKKVSKLTAVNESHEASGVVPDTHSSPEENVISLNTNELKESETQELVSPIEEGTTHQDIEKPSRIKSSKDSTLTNEVVPDKHPNPEENIISLNTNELKESKTQEMVSLSEERIIHQDVEKPSKIKFFKNSTSRNVILDQIPEENARFKKLHFDLSAYSLTDTDEVTNPLLKTMSALKKHFPFKEHLKKSSACDVSNPEQLSIDTAGLDQVIIKKSVTDSDAFLNSEIDSSSFHTVATDVKRSITKNKEIEDIMKKSVLPDDLEKMDKTPKLFESEFRKRAARKIQREETAGKGWYHMPKTEVTDEVKRDLQIIKMRNVLDSKHHYKRNDSNKLPKYFQIGTIVDGAHEFYSGRIPKKQRKRTIVQELLDDAELRRKNKKKLVEIKKRQMSKGKDYYKKLKAKKKWQRT